MKLSDEADRRSVLIDLGDTLLVEAAAGTGKTALIAGRVAMLLATDLRPAQIAAVTFTEPAAGELAERICDYVDRLIAGEVPKAMLPALPDEIVPDEMRRTLREKRQEIDQLTASTIHGFCHQLVTQYAVDIGIDPGARIMDRTTAELLFEDVLNGWLVECLSKAPSTDDPIAVLASENPAGVLTRIKKLAEFKRDHPEAETVAPSFAARPDRELVEAIRAFSSWFAGAPIERQTADILQELERLSVFYDECLADPPDFKRLWILVHPQRLSVSMVADTTRLKAYRRKTSWVKADPERGAELNDVATRHYETVDHAYRTLRGELANALVEKLSKQLDVAISNYTERKHQAASLDFADLLRHGLKLVRNPRIREELSQRYAAILIDEFQDTDKEQSEIIFSIAASSQPESWQAARLRPGALFAVGDPKQGIYSFRGADIECYREARKMIAAQPGGRVVQITDSFRSHPRIVEHVNSVFAPVFDGEEQPDYVALKSTRASTSIELPEISRLLIEPEIGSPAEDRDEEARQVAELCSRLIGAIEVERKDGKFSALVASDIALLAPTGTQLWRYERALEGVGLVVASQAGKGLFRRQEVQDVLALLRTLADPTDRLAFMALMRGPLCGLTDEELLDIDHALLMSTPAGEKPRRFGLLTPADTIHNAQAAAILPILQRLHRRRRFTTPSLLLAEAIEALTVAAILSVRHPGHSQRALANLAMLVELLRRDDVGGLDGAVQRLNQEWAAAASRTEGRVDPVGEAVELVTMHSAKGIEWPVVILINTTTKLMHEKQFLYRASDDTVHWIVDEVTPPELSLAQAEQERLLRLERKRMFYVASTRARDLLIIPHLPQAKPDSWSRLVYLKQGELPLFPVDKLPPFTRAALAKEANVQDRATFSEEAERVRAASPTLAWLQPSRADPDRSVAIDLPNPEVQVVELAAAVMGAGRVRGLILHKLMEELITGEVAESETALATRAAVLLEQLVGREPQAGQPLPEEMGRTALASIRHPAVATWRGALVAEVPVWGSRGEGNMLAGRVDAMALQDGEIKALFDWKSDRLPGADERLKHATQLRLYLNATGVDQGFILYMTELEAIAVTRPKGP
ncbi:UvrD-helicase domain-containing protein [Mesorhizobium sp. M0954]|uniref:UvrD-helicase domain-containing protein n=1 Tax=Mesorhizobium sp. M0954 TaxID=2957032 RepID=UPI0033360EE2